MDEYAAAALAKRKYSAIGAKLEVMPTWQPVACGRGNKKYGFTYRCAIFAQYENGAPRSAIGPNIISIVRRTA
eukprot:6370289-Prymnesium_polylepis.1